jgi:hypothetical protein
MRMRTLASIIAVLWISLLSAPLSTTASAANSASFVKLDASTMGSWIGIYGADGYYVSQDSNVKNPSYAQLTFNGQQRNWTWVASTTALNALQKPENPIDRIAGTWYSTTSFTIDINVTDGQSHQIALYALDWDSTLRGQTYQVLDGSTGAILDSRTLSVGSFHNGEYAIWNVQGHVKIEVDRNAWGNAVVSGVFFGGAPVPTGASTLAVPVNTFLSSLGVATYIGAGWPETNYEPKFLYTGIRNTREGAGSGAPTKLLALHQNTGTLINLMGSNVAYIINNAQTLASAGALLSVEGPNEPNNFPITYNGQTGGGSGTWVPVALYQRDLYAGVKANPTLKNYPVFAVSEGGGETDNVGMQFLTIPAGATTIMPVGTKYADYANTHNYVTGQSSVLGENQAWNAADPILRGNWDGMSAEYGFTWAHGFTGYSNAQLQSLPRVTTETGWGTLGANALTEVQQGKLFLNMYLAQFKRGWQYTFIWHMLDNEVGDSRNFGIYHSDSTPKLAATYIHNFTTILADKVSKAPGSLTYSIQGEPVTMHDLLMQRSDGTFYLAVWDERISATVDNIAVEFGGGPASVTVYDPTIGTAAVQTLSNVSSVPLTLSDHPLILAISGSAGSAMH